MNAPRFKCASGIATCILFLCARAYGASSKPADIFQGKDVEVCGFGPVMAVKTQTSQGSSLCTATLVHPEVIIFAAHCGNVEEIYWGNDVRKPERTLKPKKCMTNPLYVGNEDVDWAFCVLEEAITALPVIPVGYGCELEMYSKSGADVTQVGYGQNANPADSMDVGGAGYRRWGDNTITNVAHNEISVGPGPNNEVGCPGDSGGPLLFQMPDKSWRTFGITSTFSGSCSSGHSNTYSDVRQAVAWIEENSGVDITPCFDDDGQWSPTASCGGFFAGDASAAGTYDNWCEETPKSGLSSTCGDPFDIGDDQPPVVTITKPAAGKIEGEDGEATFELEADISDSDGSVVAAKLQIDDKDVVDSTLQGAPWQWQVKDLPLGVHTLVVIAEDNLGVTGQAEVKIEVVDASSTEEESSSASDDDDDDGSDDDDTSSNESSGDDDDDDDDDDSDDTDDDDDNADDDDADDDDDNDDADDDDDDSQASDASSNGCSMPGERLPGMVGLALLGLLSRRQRAARRR